MLIRLIVLFAYSSILFSITVNELVDSMAAIPTPIDMSSELTMILTNKKDKVKKSKLKSVSSKDSEKQIIWFLEPKKDRGISLLKIEHKGKKDEMRMWLPAFKKLRRITSDKKTGSFMGSDLSYEDLYKREKEDYRFMLEGSESVDGVECYILVSIPNKDLSSGYSKHKTWIDKKKLLPIMENSYDQNGKLLKIKKMEYSKLNTYHMIKEIFVENIQKKHSTLLSFDNTVVDIGIKDEYFNENKLKRIPK